MKVVKYTSKMKKLDPETLLRHLGAVDLDSNQCFPSSVFISAEDLEDMRKNLKRLFLEKYPRLSKFKLASAIGMEMLNYSPNESLAKAIKPGYLLIDTDAINREIDNTDEES